MIARLNLASGEVERIDYTPVPRGRDDLQPKSSPDGRWIAFRRGALPYSDLYVMAAEGGEARRLTTLHSKLRGFAWMPDSQRLVFSSDHEGSQQLFLLGINDGAVVALGGDDAEFPAVARHAPVLVYQQTRALTHLAEFAINANGDLRDPRYIAPSTRSDLMPSLSATGRYLAFVSNRTGSWEVWIHDYRLASTFPATRLNRDELTSPEWSPDERRIVFVARDGGRSELVQVDIDSGRVETLSTRNERVRFGSFSQDGRWIYFSTDRSGDWQVWRMRADRSEAEQLTREGGFDPRDYGDADGVYYAKETSRGLFRLDLATRAEQRVSWQANYFNMDTAYVRDGKLFYIDGYDENGRASLVSTPLAFDGDLSKVENSIETIGSFAATGLLPDASLAPDLMRIVVTQVQRDDTDLMTATLDDVPTRG
jgi:Tol biopolymer transport system component